MTGCVCHLLGFNPVIIMRTRYMTCTRGNCRLIMQTNKNDKGCELLWLAGPCIDPIEQSRTNISLLFISQSGCSTENMLQDVKTWFTIVVYRTNNNSRARNFVGHLHTLMRPQHVLSRLSYKWKSYSFSSPFLVTVHKPYPVINASIMLHKSLGAFRIHCCQEGQPVAEWQEYGCCWW